MNAPENRLHDEATKIAADTAVAERARPMHVRDVASYLSCCSDTLGRLGAIFSSIERQAEDKSASEVVKLAQAGSYIADFFENETDVWREEIASHGVADRTDSIVSGGEGKPVPFVSVVGEFNMSVEALDQVSSIFWAIEKEVGRAKLAFLAPLAKAGRFIASDFENSIGCFAEQIEENGVRSD